MKIIIIAIIIISPLENKQTQMNAIPKNADKEHERIPTFLHMQSSSVAKPRTDRTANVDKTGIRTDSLNTIIAIVTRSAKATAGVAMVAREGRGGV